MSTPNSMYHIAGLVNQPGALLHCGAPIPGGGSCFGTMELKTCLESKATVSSAFFNATRETWECNHCHNRQYIWVYPAKFEERTEGPKAPTAYNPAQSDNASPSSQEKASCVMCRNDFPRRCLDANFMCEPCAVWYKLAPVS